MKKINPIIAGSLMALTIISVPYATFADNDKGNEKKGKSELKHDLKVKFSKNDDNSNSFWNKFRNVFDDKKVNANTVNVALGPVISGIKSPTVLKINETGTWTIKASDPQNGSLEYMVDWGDNVNALSAQSIDSKSFVQSSTFTHAYATAGTYKVMFSVKNSAGKESTSTVTVNVKGSTVNAPVISNVKAAPTAPRHATISWTTDIRSSTMVWYSKTANIDTSSSPKISRSDRLLEHKVNLRRLEPGTTYYVVVGSKIKGEKTLSPEISFTTPAISTSTAPVITSVSGNTTIVAGTTETITVNAYDPKNGALSYSADWGDVATSSVARSNTQVFVQSATFQHVYETPGTYTATFTAENSAGQKATSSLVITVTKNQVDTVVPVISNVGITVGASTSTIKWTTDEPSTSKVYYATTTPIDMNVNPSISDGSLVTAHSITIPNLTASTLYHFKIASADGSNNVGTSSEMVFTTTF